MVAMCVAHGSRWFVRDGTLYVAAVCLEAPESMIQGFKFGPKRLEGRTIFPDGATRFAESYKLESNPENKIRDYT